MTRAQQILMAVALATVAGLGAGAGWLLLRDGASAALVPADFGQGDYRLETTTGAPFTQDSLTGQPSLVFFGFTHCPDVCPTTLGDIMGWREALGAKAEDLRVFMVSVDPERDRPEVLAAYLGWLPGAVGVTGSLRKASRLSRPFASLPARCRWTAAITRWTIPPRCWSSTPKGPL